MKRALTYEIIRTKAQSSWTLRDWAVIDCLDYFVEVAVLWASSAGGVTTLAEVSFWQVVHKLPEDLAGMGFD